MDHLGSSQPLMEDGQLRVPKPHILVHASRERLTDFSPNSSDVGVQRNGEYLELHSPLATIWSYVLGPHKCGLVTLDCGYVHCSCVVNGESLPDA